jgi:hypothetical protein
VDGIGKGSNLVVDFGLMSPWRQWASGLLYGPYMEIVIPGTRNVVVKEDGDDQLDRSVKGEVLLTANKERDVIIQRRRRRVNWICHNLCRNCLLKHVIVGKIYGRKEGSDGKTRKKK